LEYPLFEDNSVEEFRNIVLRSGYDDDLTTGSGSLVRDPLSTDIYDELGGLVSDRRWVILTINGEYWGIYDIRESVNEHFIESHIDDNNFDMVRNEGFRNQFLNRTADVLNSISKPINIVADLNTVKNEISSEIPDELEWRLF